MECLADLGLPTLAVSHYEVLTFVGRRSQATASEVAASIRRDKSTVTALIRKLEQLDLLQREPNPNDGRSSMMTLTKSGRQLYPKLLRMYAGLRRRAHATLGPGEAELLNALLRKVYEGVQ